MIFVGDDWSEANHQVCVEDDVGNVLVNRKVPDSAEGFSQFNSLVSEYIEDPAEVVLGIETDRGLFVSALTGAGYSVYAINPFSASRYRDRHVTSGAKSDPGDAKVLADIVRTDRHNHRLVAGNSDEVESIKVLARAHQNLVWTRQRQVASLRSSLREFYPGALTAFGEDLGHPDAIAILEQANTPEQGRRLSISKIQNTLAHAGRQRNLKSRAAEIQAGLRGEHLQGSPVVAGAFGATVRSSVVLIKASNEQLAELEKELSSHFEKHPDAKIIQSLPGLGVVLGARVLGEFGDDPNRYVDAKSRKNYAGTSPITKASGTKRTVIARVARNKRLADACYFWAFASLTASPGAKQHYNQRRSNGDSHHQALRHLANRWVGILHGCLKHSSFYDETTAWQQIHQEAA